MAEFTEELEPLFDYRRVQPRNVVFLDDDESGASPASSPKRRKVSDAKAENVEKNGKTVLVLDCEEKENEDWLPPPPKISSDARVLAENSTIKELRLRKQELASFAKSAEDVLRAMEDSAKRELGKSLQSSLEEAVVDEPSKPTKERAKIVISVQDKDGLKQFRMHMDDNFQRLFKMYADKVKHDLQNLVFCFDGEKIGPETTPQALEMEDNDIIEVHIKSS